jgi:hypothetical protein
MTWYVNMMKGGAPLADMPPFDAVYAAIQAGNSALRSGSADDVTVGCRENDAVYYQFSTIRTSSEEQRIARMLQSEVPEANQSAPLVIADSATIHIARSTLASPKRTTGVALCGVAGLGLALVDPRWAERATCTKCLQSVSQANPA